MSPESILAEDCVLGFGVFYHKAIAHDELVDLMRQSFALLNSSAAEGMCAEGMCGSILEVTFDVLQKNLLCAANFCARATVTTL